MVSTPYSSWYLGQKWGKLAPIPMICNLERNYGIGWKSRLRIDDSWFSWYSINDKRVMDHNNVKYYHRKKSDHDNAARRAFLPRLARLVGPWNRSPSRLYHSSSRNPTKTYPCRLGQGSRRSVSLLGPVQFSFVFYKSRNWARFFFWASCFIVCFLWRRNRFRLNYIKMMTIVLWDS